MFLLYTLKNTIFELKYVFGDKMKSSDITYVFGTGRLDKLENENFTGEFFYGYKYFSSKNLNIQIIELNESNKKNKFSSKILFFSLFQTKGNRPRNRKFRQFHPHNRGSGDICIFQNSI